MSKKVTLDKDQKYTICYSFKIKIGISANNFVLLELIKDGSIMYTRKLQATEATTFDYTAPATGEYTWRMRSSSIGTTTTQSITYSLDNLSIFYSYTYTLENCDNLADGYRFGFNGNENDNEVYGEGNAYDFGARIQDPRLGRWLSVDPLSGKFPSESPFIFCSNNPIIFKDPDGKEKIIVIGGGDAISKNDPFKFMNVGLKYAQDYNTKIANSAKSSEPLTILITDVNVSEQMKKSFMEEVHKINPNINVSYVKSGGEISNYMNSKSADNAKVSTARKNDKITDIAFVGHGYAPEHSSQGRDKYGCFEPGHGGGYFEHFIAAPEDRPVHNQWAFGVNNILATDKSIFNNGAVIDMTSMCNAAAPGVNGTSLTQVAAGYWGITAFGFDGKSDFAHIYDGQKSKGNGIRPATNHVVGGNKNDGKTPSVKMKYRPKTR